VRRIPHPTDRRATLAEITEKGRSLVAKATEALVAIEFGLASSPSPRPARWPRSSLHCGRVRVITPRRVIEAQTLRR